MTSQIKIYLVDDDKEVSKTLVRALQHHDYSVETYNSGQSFLGTVKLEDYGCIVLDVAMPGMSGLEVQTELSARGYEMPIIFITGHGDVPTSVRAIKSGAIEFMEKPFPMDLLLERIEEAVKLERQRQSNDEQAKRVIERFNSLTKREVDVMASLVAGHADRSNKEVARELDISHRTVEEYRSRIMTKMDASSVTHLVEIAKICGIYKR